MKHLLDYQTQEVANIFDEITLWSAPFGRMLLENIPMKPRATIVDIGFGTGFPLVELSQRFGNKSKIYGIDIWEAGINRTKEKIEALDIENIEILAESATKINLEDGQIDLVTSNLGVNNFEEKEKVYLEIHRILKLGGKLALTTNPIGTFDELFEVFRIVFEEMGLKIEQEKLAISIEHRNTAAGIISEVESYGLSLLKQKSDITNHRFVDATALFNHSLIRIGFRQYWEQMIREEYRNDFFHKVMNRINEIVALKGEFIITIPMLYLEFEKKAI